MAIRDHRNALNATGSTGSISSSIDIKDGSISVSELWGYLAPDATHTVRLSISSSLNGNTAKVAVYLNYEELRRLTDKLHEHLEKAQQYPDREQWAEHFFDGVQMLPNAPRTQ